MKRFKVGDRVKSVNGFGTIKEIVKSKPNILVYHDDWNGGHDGNFISTKVYQGRHCWFFNEDELELIGEIKIITPSSFTIKADRLDIGGLYKREVLGMWVKENPMIKKEGNEMIESMNLIDLYASKHKESVERETKEKVEELRKNCDVINKYNELVEQFKKDCEELYLSQFTEEEKNEIMINRVIDDSDMQLRRNCGTLCNYAVNENFHNDEYFNIMDYRSDRLSEIDDLVKTVKAHVSIAKTKEEVEEILTRYGIIDKKGKLVV